MRTRREQVQAHRFVTRRIVSALVSGNPESMELPMRRTAASVVGGALIALLVFAGFALVGMLWPAPATDFAERNNSIIVNEETGAVYAFREFTLFPVPNLVSARLLFDADVAVYHVTSAELSGVDVGWEVGIVGAPRQLPTGDELVGLPWRVCSVPDAGNSALRRSHVLLGGAAEGTPLGERALAVFDGDRTWLLWNDTRLPVPDVESLYVVGLNPDRVSHVTPVFTAALATGPEFARPDIPGDGEAAGDIGGRPARYGDLFSLNDTVWVLTEDGFAEVGEVMAQLLELTGSAAARVVSAGVVQEHGTTTVQPEGFPSEMPEVADPAVVERVCADYASESGPVTVTLEPALPDYLHTPVTTPGESERDDVDTADHVWLPGGSAALVDEAAPQATYTGTRYLIDDTGTRYPMTPVAAERLGLADLPAVRVPPALLALIPTGPTLDEVAAMAPVPP